MIIGNGQLANAFKEFDDKEIVIFASGVADSNCIDEKQFERERLLLTSTLSKYNDKTFVYFSSCALSAKEYPLNDYYKHKKQMELLIKKTTENYYIFRIPQLFGKLKTHYAQFFVGLACLRAASNISSFERVPIPLASPSSTIFCIAAILSVRS